MGAPRRCAENGLKGTEGQKEQLGGNGSGPGEGRCGWDQGRGSGGDKMGLHCEDPLKLDLIGCGYGLMWSLRVKHSCRVFVLTWEDGVAINLRGRLGGESLWMKIRGGQFWDTLTLRSEEEEFWGEICM